MVLADITRKPLSQCRGQIKLKSCPKKLSGVISSPQKFGLFEPPSSPVTSGPLRSFSQGSPNGATEVTKVVQDRSSKYVGMAHHTRHSVREAVTRTAALVAVGAQCDRVEASFWGVSDSVERQQKDALANQYRLAHHAV